MSASTEPGMVESTRSSGTQGSTLAKDTAVTGGEQAKRSSGPRPGQRLFGLHDAAVYLGCSERTVRDLILDGKIPQVSLTSRIQVDVKDLDALIATKKKVCAY